MSQDRNGWRPVVVSDPESGEQLHDRCMVSNGKDAKLIIVEGDDKDLDGLLEKKVMKEIKRVLKKDGFFVMFVGSNTIRNQFVPTHLLLRKIAEQNVGFKTNTYFYHRIKRKKLGIPRNITGGEIPEEMAIVFQKR